MLRRSALAIAFCLGLSSCSHGGSAPSAPPPTHAPEVLTIRTAKGAVQLHVELAITQAEQQRGLMSRTTLAPSDGMAFLFDSPTTVGFWMKDTLIPLSIAFWDEHSVIVAIDEMTPCTQDPCTTYGPKVPYRGAVEANTGYFAAHGVEIGDTIQLGGTAQ